jgi:hypothetical protein
LQVRESIVPVIDPHGFKRRSRVALDDASAEDCAFSYRLPDGEPADGRVRLRGVGPLLWPSLRRRRRKPGPQRPEAEIATRPAGAPRDSHDIATWISRHGFAPAGFFFSRNHEPALSGKQPPDCP